MLLPRFAPLFITLFLPVVILHAADRPNILWLTSEDNAAQWIGCYGNKVASTPRIDALAAEGLKFTRAYSNGPVCAVARSTILNGAYAVTQGTEHMRSRHPIPPAFKAGVTWLRESGYYCTNNAKTDYNFKGNDAALWDDCSNTATYQNRPAGKPFFAVYNIFTTHESQLFPGVVATNRAKGVIPNVPRLNPSQVTVPPYMPDLPEVRSDIAIYHDCVSAMDKNVGVLLDQLKSQGLAEDTIVFYYSDHGGAMARGKRYLQDTGVHVPLVIYVPEKWRKLSPFPPASEVSEIVAFVDFAPTILSLAGLKTPAPMQGRAFLGEHRAAPAADPQAFLFADRFDETDGMRRAITDGRYKYIRCFSPHLPGAPYSEYAMGQPSWLAWQRAWKSGKLAEAHASIWNAPQPVEMLFDRESDPWEIKNLAGSPEQAERLKAMRTKLHATMASVVDTGLIPEALWDKLAGNKTIHDYVHSPSFQLDATLDIAFAASSSDPANLPALVKALTSPDPVIRYWGATGCLILGKSASSAVAALTEALGDHEHLVAIVAAEALQAAEKEVGSAALIGWLDRDCTNIEFQFLGNAIMNRGLKDSIPSEWAMKLIGDSQAPPFKKQFARDLIHPGERQQKLAGELK